jgi:hypothetical protein
MKIAILISGYPRFCHVFDFQLEWFKDYDVDWFVTLWNPEGNERFPIGPSWQYIDDQIVTQLLNDRISARHKIAHVDVRNPSELPPNPFPYQGWYYNADSLWSQYTILRWCDQVRQSYEQQTGAYDILIRTRPDVLITGSIDLEYYHQQLLQDPKAIMIPYPDRSGAGFNDMFAICTSPGMTDYTSSLDGRRCIKEVFHGILNF